MKSESERRELAPERAKELLSERELAAYTIWRGTEQPALAPTLNAKLFSLFLQGKGCEEIRRLNQALSLGQILHARLVGDWDRRRDEHLDRLLTETSLRVQQVTLETADFVCDLLAVANREHGDRLRRYMQSGDPSELGEFKIDSLGGLKQVVEILQKLTGQDKQQVVSHRGEVVHRPGEPILSVAREPSSAEAASALKLLLGRV